MALGDDSQLTFLERPSTFSSIAAQADNGVIVQTDLSTAAGVLYLDGDDEDSSSQDGVNTVGFTDGRTVSAKTIMTMEATTGLIIPNGDLTLKAGAGLTFVSNLLGAVSGKLLTMSADYESAGDGTFTVATLKTLVKKSSS